MADKDDLLSKVLDFADLVDYQDGSVVSRTLISADTGTVTLFSFDKEQSLSEHTAPFDALVYIIEGQAQINISGQPYQLSQGQIIICIQYKYVFRICGLGHI